MAGWWESVLKKKNASESTQWHRYTTYGCKKWYRQRFCLGENVVFCSWCSSHDGDVRIGSRSDAFWRKHTRIVRTQKKRLRQASKGGCARRKILYKLFRIFVGRAINRVCHFWEDRKYSSYIKGRPRHHQLSSCQFSFAQDRRTKKIFIYFRIFVYFSVIQFSSWIAWWWVNSQKTHCNLPILSIMVEKSATVQTVSSKYCG